MAIEYLLSWGLNVLLWGIIIAIVDEGKQYYLERIPEVPFLLAIVLPTVLEIIAYTFEAKPFLAVIWPAFSALI